MLITSTHTHAQRNTRYDPISTCTGILTCSSPYAAQRDGSPHLLLSHTHTDLHMQIQNHLMSTHTLAHCLHAHYKHRETVCYPASTYPGILSCTGLHMQDVESRHAHMHVIQHALQFCAVPDARPDTVHFSCSFSFAIRASAHESPLSLSSSLPRSPFILSPSLGCLAL